MEALAARPATQHVVITGRGAPQALIKAADLVNEILDIKHPLKSGVLAQMGIELKEKNVSIIGGFMPENEPNTDFCDPMLFTM